jgi:cell division protein ZapE
VEKLRRFARVVPARRRFFRKSGQGIYLDGGFGIGKTHLMAACFRALPQPASWFSFQDLMYLAGALGIPATIQGLRGRSALAVDEFELDDPGNAQLAGKIIGDLMDQGVWVICTSNTPPEQLGQGRFDVERFQAQLARLAQRFEVLRIEGDDYRKRLQPASAPAGELGSLRTARIRAGELLEQLRKVHPALFHHLLEGLDLLVVEGDLQLASLDDALRLVHFTDKVYESGTAMVPPEGDPFGGSYRNGPFQRKFSRCLSRMAQLRGESQQLWLSPAAAGGG